MDYIFKLGTHNIFGISLADIKPLRIRNFWITFLFVHFTIQYNRNKFRVGFMVGNRQMYFKIHVGLE